MDEIKQFFSKYALFILIAGILLFILAITAINNLPNPFYLYPGESQEKYYTPLKIYRALRFFGVIITLVAAYFLVQEKFLKTNSSNSNADKISSAITGGIASLMSPSHNPETKIFEAVKEKRSSESDYILIDEKNNSIVGINQILNSLTSSGYRIINTIETTTEDNEVLQIVVEK